MANWKKIVVSGSSPDLHLITGSGLQLTNPSHSSDLTPLVIDANGNVSTGSAYVTSSGVTGNGLDSNIVIIGSGSSAVQIASSTQNANFNSADVFGITELTASNANFTKIALSSSEHAISSTILQHSSSDGVNQFVEIPSTDLDGLIIRPGVTMSKVPLVPYINEKLGIDTNGEIVKVRDTGGGATSGVSGLTTCSNGNINLNAQVGSSTTSFEYVASKGLIADGTNQFIAGNDSFVNLAPGDLIQIRATYQGTEHTLDTSVSEIRGPGGSDGFPGTTTYAVSSSMSVADNWDKGFSSISVATVYRRVVGSSTGIVEICLDDNISLQSITASNGIIVSGSDAKLEVTGSFSATGSVELDGTLAFNGLNFTQANVGIITGSNTFGSGSEPSLVSHQFTGSVFITGSDVKLKDGVFTGDGSGLTNLDTNDLGLKTLTILNGLTGTTYNPSASSEIGILLDGSTLITGSGGIKVSESGITSTELQDGSVTSTKLNNQVISALSSNITDDLLLDSSSGASSILISSASALHQTDLSVLTSVISRSFSNDGLFGTDNTDTTYSLTATHSAGGTDTVIRLTDNNGVETNVDIDGVSNEIDITLDDSSNKITIGLPNDVIIGNDLTVTTDLDVDGAADIAGNLVVGGNLTVNGSTTTINTEDLVVEDRFIIIGSGSVNNNNTDVGIIFDSGSVDGAGMALYYDDSANRLAVGTGVNDINMDASAAVGAGGGGQGTVAGDIVTVSSGSVTPDSTAAAFGQGEMRIDNSNDIWIYVD